MKPRHPSKEELKHWRESNRFTRKKKDDAELEEEVGDEVFLDHVTPTETKALPVSSKAKKATSSLAPLPTREAKKRLASSPKIDATLDLHGFSKLEAYARVKSFIAAQQQAGKRHLLIITGKGRTGEGILRAELPHWLNEPALRPLISAFTHGTQQKGGNGVTHVLVKSLVRSRKS